MPPAILDLPKTRAVTTSARQAEGRNEDAAQHLM